MFCAFMFKFYVKAQKHACFYLFSSSSVSFYPHYIIMVKGLFSPPPSLSHHVSCGSFLMCPLFQGIVRMRYFRMNILHKTTSSHEAYRFT